jgi:NAD(P)-dependent dehydrogenase (short-subunit alcohol dehydrogenase family)
MTRLLEGKVAVVTGSGHGIGRAHALELAEHGALVVVNDLGSTVTGEGSGRDADHVVDIIASRGGQAIADYGDVGDEEQADRLVARAIDTFGRLDILVNNAGIVRDRVVWKMTTDDFDKVIRVHLRGTWLTCRAAARHWRDAAKQSPSGRVFGRIINTTSGAGLVGNFGQGNYAAAKAGIVGLTLTLALELASIGVTVNAIGPGGLTRLSATMPGMPAPVEPDERPDDTFDPQDPSLASPVVAWLASDEAQYVSGQVIRAMGQYLHWMAGWSERTTISNGGVRWDATTLGRRLATDVFQTQAAGLRLGS